MVNINDYYKIEYTETECIQTYYCPECKQVVSGKSIKDWIPYGSNVRYHRLCYIKMLNDKAILHNEWREYYKNITLLPDVV